MNNKGFTMVEVLGVVTILVIISLFTFPIISSLTNDTTSKNKQFLDSLYQATETYLEMNYERFKNNEISYISASKLIEEGLLSNSLINPNTNKRVIDEDGVIEATRDVDNSFKYNYAINQYITINYIEDLIEILDSGDNYEGKTIVLNRDLDFKKDESYKDINTSYKESTLKLYLNTSGVTQKSSDFKGNISGNGYSIDNIYMTGNSLGLFNLIKTSTIENINLSGIIDGNTGGLLATTISDTLINNINVDIKVPYNSNISNASIGGIALDTTNVSISNSSVTTDINLSNTSNIGGFIGIASITKIENCKQSGSISGGNVAGIIREMSNHTKIINSSSQGKIRGNDVGGLVILSDTSEIKNSFSTATLIGEKIGGLASSIIQETKISNSYYAGNIDAINSTGGLVRNASESTVESSYVVANIECSSCLLLGGLIGEGTNLTIKNSYNLSNINYGNSTGTIGGLISSINNSSIINTYSSGLITGTNINTIVGGLIGSSTSSTITSSYSNSDLYNGNLIGNSASTDIINNSNNLTNEEMLKESSYNGWDFTNIWNIQNNGLPTLRKGS